MYSGTDLTLKNMTKKGLLQSDVLPNLLTYLSRTSRLKHRNEEDVLNDHIVTLKPFADTYIDLINIQLLTASAGLNNPQTQLKTLSQALGKCDPSLVAEIKRQLVERKMSDEESKLSYYKAIIRARCEQLEHVALICATWGLFISEKEESADNNDPLETKRDSTYFALRSELYNLSTKFNIYPFSDKKDINLKFNTSLISSSQAVSESFVKWGNTYKPGKEFKAAASSSSASIHSRDSKLEKKRDTNKPEALIDESKLNTTAEFTRQNQAQRRPKLKVKGILIGGALAVIPPVALAIAWATNPILAFGYTVLAMLVGAIVGGVIDNSCCRRDGSLRAGAKRKLSDPGEESEASPPLGHSSVRTQKALAAGAPSLRRRPVTSSSASAPARPSGEAKRQGSSAISESMQQTLGAAHHRGGQITKVGDAAADIADSATDFAAGAAKLRKKQAQSWF